MEVLIIIGSVFLIFLGILGSFLPILPGPLTSWLGLLLIHQHPNIKENPTFIWITFAVALIVFLLDYFIPAIGTKKFGGTKNGACGASIGLVLGLISPVPFGVIIGPFLGAYFGELLLDSNQKKALKSALGSLIGFLGGVFIKLFVSVVYLYYFFAIVFNELM
ncbi:MAG: DUF456 domain-containing protein [Flavobacteriaceae bacterium]|jgi:uncharacterized protein YqgC (DUF456 family)|nr:DUF456 domain-containing protein [Flavobacteriaceae bacterium]